MGWKTADVDLYPAPYTGMHYLDDAVWAQNLTVPPIPWLDLIWPAVAPRAGESIDLSFVITRKPDPTGAGEAPKQYNLEQNYPNPFNPSTTIRYSLPEAANVELAIFGVDGALVRVLDTGMKPAGVFEAHWDGRDRRGHAVAVRFDVADPEASSGRSSPSTPARTRRTASRRQRRWCS